MSAREDGHLTDAQVSDYTDGAVDAVTRVDRRSTALPRARWNPAGPLTGHSTAWPVGVIATTRPTVRPFLPGLLWGTSLLVPTPDRHDAHQRWPQC